MIKIFYDNIIFDLQKSGGISKYWGKLIKCLSDNEEVEIQCLESNESKKSLFYPDNCTYKKISDNLLPLFFRRYFHIFIDTKFDLFHSSYYRTPFFLCKNVKHVVTVHDFMYEFFDSGIKKHVHVWQKKKAMLKADAIICVSKHTKKDLLMLYPEINPKNVYIVPNGVDKDFFKLQARDKNITINSINFEHKKFLLYVGNRVGCKNFNFILEMLNNSEFIKTKKFKLVCVGGGELSNLEINEIKRYNLEDLILPMKSINNQDLNYLYNMAYALIFPSKYEGFGIPALEAQIAGCPVVYAKTSSLPEVMGYPELGYELDNIIEAIQKLESLEDENLRNKVVNAGILHASKLSWENTANLTLEVYKKILEHN